MNNAMIAQSFYGCFQTRNKFGHKTTDCRSKMRRSENGPQHGMTCYNYNKPGHIDRFCKGKNGRSSLPQNEY